MTPFDTPAYLAKFILRRDTSLWVRMEQEGTYQVFTNTGPNANQDAPDFTNQAIQSFLGRLESKPGS